MLTQKISTKSARFTTFLNSRQNTVNAFEISYSMIIWNCQKVNQSNSALKPFPRLHNVPKVAFVWDILIFQAFGTFRFTGESHGAYLNLKTLVNIEGI